ncbi:MAG: phosphate/phosphite/phosphonate ABC transporter substrate-binding protein, partial [Opitutae bacterium]|nr:phosphate/phosphite/phosphonate ABC transporter substrate-binding protein [Opitutae bacterium]
MKFTFKSIARTFSSICLAALAFLFASCGGNSADDDANGTSPDGGLSLKQLVIALKANKNPEKMLAEKEALEKYLSEKLARQVKVIIPTSSAAIVESFKNGTLDIGYLSSTDAARNLDDAAASILLIHLKNGNPHYNSIWLSLKNKDYDSIEDLKDKPVAFASHSSTSGFLIPTWDLSKRGLVGPNKALTDYFAQTIYGTGYVSAVEKVLNGEVEAAAVSDYVYKGDNKYLSDEQKAKLKIVQEQGPVPSHTICYRLSLSAADRDVIRQTLLGMNEDNPELRDKVFNGELVTVDPEEH